MLAAAAVSAGISLYQQNKAKNDARSAARESQVNINDLNTQVQDQARGNELYSRSLENEFDPQNAQLRTDSVKQLLSLLGPDAYSKTFQDQLSAGNPLLDKAYSLAQQDLQNPGEVPLDVFNQIARGAAATSGSVNRGSGLGLSRDLQARDLGLTSLALRNQQLSNAQSLGSAATSDAATRAQIVDSLTQSGYGRAMGLAQFGQSIARPIGGLDPSAVANLNVANKNAMGASYTNQANINSASAQGWMQLAGAFAGGGGGMGGGAKSSSVATPPYQQRPLMAQGTSYQAQGTPYYGGGPYSFLNTYNQMNR